MNSVKRAIATLAVPCLLVTACAKPSMEDIAPSGAKSAISIMHILAKRSQQTNRPSGPLGIFAGLFTSQGVILPVKGAIVGLEVIKNIIKGQSTSTTDENFALLREIGDVLQVNIVDALNRSVDRAATLDAYTQSLNNTGILTERKIAQLETLKENQDDASKASRKKVRDLEKNLRSALKDQDYAEASEYEEQLSGLNAEYAEISTKYDQTKDMLKRFEALLEITAQRHQAMTNNREILIAGLRVIKMPGIADLNILEEGRSWSKRRGTQIFQN